MTIYVYPFDQDQNQFNPINYQQEIYITTNLIYFFQQQRYTFLYNKLTTTQVTCDNHNNLIVLSLNHPQKQFLTQQQFDENLNLLLINNGISSLIAKNLPNLNSSKNQINSNNNFIINKNWWLYEQYGIIITLTADVINNEQLVQFQYLDNLETSVNPLKLKSSDQAFWFNNYETLIVCSEKQITSYQIQQHQLILNYTFEYANQINNCFQVFLNPFIFCQNQGAFNFLNKQFYLQPDLLNVDNIFVENQKYIFFKTQVLFEVSKGTFQLIQLNNIEFDVENMKLSPYFNDQGFYVVPNQYCFIFSLPDFDSIVSYDLIGESNSYTCDFNPELSIYSIYYNETLSSYQFPVQYSGQTQLIFKLEIPFNLQNYFSSKSYIFRKYFVSYKYFTFNTYDQYLYLLLIDIQNGEIIQINNFLHSGSAEYFFVDIWEEKDVILSNDILISISDIQLTLSFDNKQKIDTQQISYSKLYNYIIYQANDSKQLVSLDISEIFPINSQIGQISSRYSNYSINFYHVSDIDQDHQQVELIYFNQKLSQLIKWKFISLNQALNQNQYLQNTEKQVVLDVTYIFNEMIKQQKINKQAAQTQYKIYLLYKDDIQKIFAFYFKCQAVIFNEDHQVLQIIDLQQYQCQIMVSRQYSSPSLSNQQLESQKIYLISQEQTIINIFYQNYNVILKNVYTEQQQDDYKIQSLISISLEDIQVSIITYQNFKNTITILMENQNIIFYKKFTFDQIQNIYSYCLESISKKVILLIGTEQNLLIQQIIWDQIKNEIQLVELSQFSLNQKGQSQLLYTLKQVTQNSNFEKIMLILTTQKRIMLFQNSESNALSFDLIRENLKHLRGQHQIQIHQNNQNNEIQILSLFSQLQVSFYSLPSLQFISRIEEKNAIQITSVHLVFSVEIIVIVCNQQEIQIFVLSRLNKEKKLLLQNSIKLSSATIYNVANMNQNMVVFHGTNLRGYFIIYYSLSDNQIFQNLNQEYSNLQNGSCLNIFQLQNQIQYQEMQFNQIIMQDNHPDSTTIQISVDLSASIDLFIPKYMIYQSSLYQKKYIDYRINLMGFLGTPKQYSLSNYQKILQKIQINNGILYIDSDIVFQDLNSFILENISIRFSSKNCKLTILNVQEVIFENVSILDQQIENSNRQNQISQDGQLMLNPLIKLQNCSNVLIFGMQLQKLSVQQDFFQFEDVQNIQVEKVRCQDLLLIGTLFSFRNQFKILSQTSIENILLSKSLIISLFQILNVNILNIHNIQLQQINNISNNPTEIENQFYQTYQKINYSLIKITLILDRALITQLILRNQVNHQSLLDYKNFYDFKNETFSSQTSNLIIKNVYINQCYFQKYAFYITENQAHLQQIVISNTNNTSLILYYIEKGLKMIDIKCIDNFYDENSIIEILNSQVKLSKITILRNKVTSHLNTLNSISLTNTNFLIDILSADKNTSPSGFLFINGIFNKNVDFLTSSQQNLVNNCIITHCNNNAIILKNLQQINFINSIFSDNSLEKQVDDGGALKMNKVELCYLSNSQIKNNFAKKYGGGISMQDSDLFIVNSQIQNNQAVIGGGLRFFNQNNQLPKHFFTSQFKSQIINNKAEFFGNNLASIPFKIKFLSDLDNLKISLNQFSTSFIFQVYGVDGELIKYNKYTQRLMQEGYDFFNQYQQFELISDQKSVQIENQVRTYNVEKNYFNITCNLLDYGYNELLEMQNKNTDLNDFYKKRRIIQLKVLSNPLYQIDFSISFSQCQVGQLILGLQQNLYQCYQCNENTYSIINPYTNINTSKCQGCPVGAISCQGSKIQLEEGYWKQEGTYFVIYCHNKPNKCTQKVQSNEFNNQQSNGCIEGGFGPLCESCDYKNIIWGRDQDDAYAKINMYDCINCKEVNIFDQFIKFIVIFAFIACLSYQLINETLNSILFLQCQILKCLNLVILNSSFIFRQKHSIILKIILSYLQVISMIVFNQQTVNNSIKDTLLFFGNILELLNYILDCVFVQSSLHKKFINMVYLRLIWTLILCFSIFIILILLSYAVCNVLKIQKRYKNVKQSLIIKLYLVLLPGLIVQLMSTIWCRYINNEYYVQRDVQFNCFDNQYFIFNFIISIPLLITLILFPLYLFKKLYQNRFQLNKPQFYMSYGFVYSEYKEKLYYWQIIKIYKNILIFVIVQLFNQMFETMSIIVIILLIFYIKFQQIHLPYKNSYFGDLDIFSQLCLIFTIFCLIVYNSANSIGLVYTSITFTILINFVLLMRIFYLLLSQNKFSKFFLKCLQFFSFNFSKKFYIQQQNYQAIDILRVTKNWKKIQNVIRKNKTQHKRLLSAINIPTQRFIQEIEEQNEQNSLNERQSTSLQKKTQSHRFQIQSLTNVPETEVDYNIQLENIFINEQNINQLNRQTIFQKPIYNKQQQI
ncbi:transmembrane protein, putative (macronuclear) [Tetrahymena thermophila SB210]|uniref:Transmembrane protein, putative n=1 Tax=Tetrahymena thermophila (strain SB210) TaxID=312017 RepID=I7MHQ7_TETTS|nr:transmembrane protein, putative [Tetrahymena thermophila SB210]EAS03199.2 transmembrane protein, putative [Tetrahymena thermophila SB210]|eukprot:XP_001023444.2 transmembrane protein, putative [Tetrahymena thermophila SB210]